jgi:hypothetical protein
MNRLETHGSAIQYLIQAIEHLTAPEQPIRRKIGFQLPSG